VAVRGLAAPRPHVDVVLLGEVFVVLVAAGALLVRARGARVLAGVVTAAPLRLRFVVLAFLALPPLRLRVHHIHRLHCAAHHR
jgi:hypothetical protein